MGKIRIKTIGDESLEGQEKSKSAQKRAGKKAREAASEQGEEKKFIASENLSDSVIAREISQDSNKEKPATAQAQKQTETLKKKKSKFIKAKSRSSNYTAKVMEIDKNKTYSLPVALELLKKVNLAKFDATVELHINTTEAGINGVVKLPHGTGKEIRVAIVTDELIEQIEKGLPAARLPAGQSRQGKINFDILIAAPSMMPKLARVAKVLGPRGLMPNPKNGTISDKPEDAAKKFQGGQISFKTESKVPLMHLTVGKMSFGDEKLSENIKTIISAIKKGRITKITLKSTMSPGIKLTV